MHRLRTIILIGFVAIIMLVTVSITISLSAISGSNDRLARQVTINEQKIDLITYMRTAARERSLALTRMLTISDEQRLEQEFDAIVANGGVFVDKIARYMKFDLNEEEVAVMRRHAELADVIAPLQYEIADMILFGDREQAQQVLLDDAIPLQNQAFENLSKLITIQREQGVRMLIENGESYRTLISHLWLVFITAVILSIIILLQILRVITRYEVLQQRSTEALEEQVEIRTRELIESRDEAISANLEAQRANKAKSDFLSRMSHELRTPLNSIIGFSSLIIYSRQTDERTRQRLQHMKNAGEHLLTLIDEVLDLTRIETGAIKLNVRPNRLSTILDRCEKLIQPMIEQSGLTLVFDTDVPYIVRADATRLEQALINLLTNAIKYNQNGGQITVRYQTLKGSRLRISVSDTGIGISHADQQLLFEPFERLGAEHSEVEGTGIGLTITRQLMNIMGGSVGVSSEPGRGSTFWVDLDLLENTTEVEQGLESAEEEAFVNPSGSKQIVYVEDNTSSLILMREIINQMTRHELITADNGERGLELILDNLPDVALLDINLPDISGYQILERLKQHPQAKKIRVIAVSANAMPSDIEQGMAAGFDAYLTKPIKMEELLRSIA